MVVRKTATVEVQKITPMIHSGEWYITFSWRVSVSVMCLYLSLVHRSPISSKEAADIMQWAVALSLLIALLTLLIHTLLCYVTRRWAYRAAVRAQRHANIEGVRLSQEKRKKLKRRKPRPKFRTPLMLHYSSSTDCSL